jgi:hypothetical protein
VNDVLAALESWCSHSAEKAVEFAREYRRPITLLTCMINSDPRRREVDVDGLFMIDDWLCTHIVRAAWPPPLPRKTIILMDDPLPRLGLPCGRYKASLGFCHTIPSVRGRES